MSEVWKIVVGWPTYEVSDLGRVRKGSVLLAQSPFQGKKYLRVTLNEGGRRKTARVHLLVLEAFVGPCPVGCQGLHRNDDQADNALSNLRWGTPLENAEDRARNGKQPTGSGHWRTDLTEAQVLDIRTRALAGRHGIGRELAKEYGVTDTVISRIKRGERWRHTA